jgi:hypothetical protein
MAIFVREYSFFSSNKIDSFHCKDNVFRLFAIGSNISHRSSSYLSRDIDQIFSSNQSLLEHPHHCFMPVFSGSCFDIYEVIFLFKYFFTQERCFDDKSFIVFREEDIRSAT